MTSLVLLAALAAAEKPVISVMYFENRTTNAELDVARKGIADLMITDLVAWDGVVVVEREKLESVLGELKLQQSKAFDPATAVKVGKLVGAQYLLTGSMVLQGNELILDARLMKVQDGSQVLAARAKNDQDKIFDLEQELVGKVIASIDSKLAPNEDKRRRAKVPTMDALVAYSKAIDLSDKGQLKEAQAAMQALISKAPTFLLARERRDELLKRFQEYELKKKDLISGAALELGKVIDEGLKDEGRLDSLSQEAAARYLTLRMLKGRYILRVLKQHLSAHGGHVRVPLRGHEAEALLGMRAWLDNQRKLDAEIARVQKKHQWISARLPPAEAKLVEDAKFGSLNFLEFIPTADFVLFGRADDGEGFKLSPALGFVDPKERTAVLDELEKRIVAAITRAKKEPQQEYQASQLIELKARAAIDVGNVDASVTELQRFLDAFPTSANASRFEERIKEQLSGNIRELEKPQRWAKALKGCDGMDLIVGAATSSDYLHKQGLSGLDKMAKDLETACPPTKKNQRYVAQVYKDIGQEAARHDDCTLYQAMTAKSLALGYSVRDTLGYAKRLEWCDLKPVLKDVSWFFSKMDRDWELEFVEELSSSWSGEVLTLKGSARLGTPNGVVNEPIVLEASQAGGGWRCTSVSLDYHMYGPITGECSVTVTKLASGKGDFDEGTFSASFNTGDRMRKKLELSDGQFKLKRQ
ncbi:MAG: CsgG/HfaB family protein [Myxococcota bacterium]